jgi:hypothetical protein
MGNYNLACWKMYLGAVSQSLRAGKKFDAGAADRAVRNHTEKWIHQRNEYPVEAEGDSIAVARMIWEKYAAKAPAVKAPTAPQNINHRE